MVFFALAFIFLIVGIVLLARCMMLRKKAHEAENSYNIETKEKETEKAETYYKKANKLLGFGILCLVLAESFILIGNHMK